MITEKVFGQTQDGQTVTLYSISNENGFQADVMNYGAILVNLFVPNKRGSPAFIAAKRKFITVFIFRLPFLRLFCILRKEVARLNAARL